MMMTVSVNRLVLTSDGMLGISTPYDKTFISRIKLVTGRHWDRKTKMWYIPIYNKDELYRFVPLSNNIKTKVNELYDKFIDIDRVDTSSLVLANGYRLYPFQVEATKFAVSRGKCLLALDLGLGKSLISLSYSKILSKTVPGLDKILLTVPKRLVHNWKCEIEKFYPGEFDYVIIEGDWYTRHRLWEQSHQMYIFHYDLLNIDNDYKYISDICNDNNVIIIADEVTKVKSWRAKRTRRLMKLRSKYRIGLSAIPLENRLEELYTIVRWLGNNVFGTFKDFDDKYILRDMYGSVIDYVNLDEVRDKLKLFMYRKTKAQVMSDLPPIVVENIPIELSDVEKSDYRVIEHTLRAQVTKYGDEVTSTYRTDVLSFLTMARLYCDHPALVSQSSSKTAMTFKSRMKATKGSKLEALIDILSTFGDNKVVIFTHFKRMAKYMYDVVRKEYPDKDVTMVSGGMKNSDVDSILEHFEKYGDILISTDILSYGINMQYCSYIINYDLHFNPVVNQQRVGRLHRIGQKSTVTVINLVVDDHDKVERWVDSILRRKEGVIEKVLEA